MPKGILIVNAFKDKPLFERTESAFQNQMLSYCKKMELNLMTSTQLLGLYLDFKLGDISLEKIQQLLWNTIGIFDYNSKKIKKV